MLPDFFGGGHMLIVGMVALLVIGPKDLPKMLRQLGKAVGAVRRMAEDLKTSIEDMARQSELDELRAEVDSLRLAQAEAPVLAQEVVEGPTVSAPKPPRARTRKPRAPKSEAQAKA